MASEELIFCDKCKKAMKSGEFYGSNNLEKYPDGKIHTCKKCITMHVDNWDPESFMWILQECDVPYVAEEWNNLLQKYGQDKSKVTGTTILGRYLSKMKLKQWKDYRWKDSAFLQELADHKVEEAMKRQGYSAAEITQQLMDNSTVIPEEEIPIPEYTDEFGNTSAAANEEDYFAKQNAGLETDLIADLTEDDKKALLLKWGRMYKPEEWIQLEQLYQEMMQSYDIQSAGDINTLKLACKASLKANQLLDIGDIDGAQKMAKVYDGMMKAGKWTAAQNKKEEDDVVDSIGEIVAICETDGFIAKYYVDSPKDKVDRVIQDMQIFNRQLVTEELNLGNMIENSVKSIQHEKEQIAEAAKEAEEGKNSEEDKMFDYSKPAVSFEDYTEFTEFEDNLSDEAQQVYKDQEDE